MLIAKRRSTGSVVPIRGEYWALRFDAKRVQQQENCAHRGRHRLHWKREKRGHWACPHCGLFIDWTKNLVTADGAQYWAELTAGEAPTRDYGNGDISTFTNSPTIDASIGFNELTIPSGGTQPIASGFPATNASDGGNNPGTFGVTTWTARADFASGDANDTLLGAAVHENGASGTDPLMNAARFSASVVKTTAFALRVYSNQTAAGV